MNIPINYLAVLVAGIVQMAIGAFWYSPAAFGNVWAKLSGISPEKIEAMKKGGMNKSYALMFASALVMVYILAHFVFVWGAVDVAGALELAFRAWLGFIATTMLGSVIWEGKTVKLYVINALYYLVSLAVTANILAYWR